MTSWEFWIDVGGTFTDSFARRPDGTLAHHKLLSSGVVKGAVGAGSTADRIVDPARGGDPDDFWTGWRLRLLDDQGQTLAGSRLAGFEAATATLHLADPLAEAPAAGTPYELASEAEAPLVAIRYLLGLPHAAAVPPSSVRLGTTRGTNALITRRGARAALVTTRGFADVLEIGYQNRPRLFDLAIHKPPSLAAAVVEIDERIDAAGRVLVAPDEAEIGRQLLALRAAGIESLAICLLHSFVRGDHEALVERVAREVGFDEISVSSRIAPLAKIVSRGDTTVVDAYLNPVLRRYVGRLREALAGSSLRILTSAGGLVEADQFVGKDSILSGPAGGVVGFSRVAAAAGFERAIGFDMGGTSTDVSRYRRPAPAGVRNGKGRRAARGADDGHRDRGGRRRLDLPLRRRQAGRGARQRRRRPGPGLLRPRRAADGDRRQLSARQDSARPFSVSARPPRGRSAARRNDRGHRRGRRAALRTVGAGRRLRARGQRQHGQGDSLDLGGQGVRSSRLRAGALWRGRRTACLRGGGRVGHRPDPAPPARRAAERLRHRAGRRRAAPGCRRLRAAVAGAGRALASRRRRVGARGGRGRGGRRDRPRAGRSHAVARAALSRRRGVARRAVSRARRAGAVQRSVRRRAPQALRLRARRPRVGSGRRARRSPRPFGEPPAPLGARGCAAGHQPAHGGSLFRRAAARGRGVRPPGARARRYLCRAGDRLRKRFDDAGRPALAGRSPFGRRAIGRARGAARRSARPSRPRPIR